jgi:hypothetical protein
MASIAYALSIQHFINSVGAKAGFASIIGLALLVLLFFTQSRETANLRRRADEAEQQLYQLQLHVDHLSRQRAQQAAAPAAAQATGAPVAAPPAVAALARSGATRSVPGEQVPAGAVATIPAAPAGVGAPALSSATRLIPLAEPDEISIRALRPSTNGDGEGRVGAVSEATVATPPPAPAPGPAPSTAAGGANGAARPPVVPMPDLGGSTQSTPARGALPRQQRPPAPPARPPSRRAGGLGRPTSRISPVFFVLAGILVAAVVAVVLVFVSGSSNNSSPPSSSSGSSAASASSTNATGNGKAQGKAGKQRKTTVTVTPSSVTLAVLNSTGTQGLAAKVMGKLTDAGYKGTTTQNAAETGLTSTIVGYTAPGARADALAVAKSLNLSQSSVRTVSQGDRLKICGSATSACSTQVIVTLGSDLAQTG